MDVVLEEKIKDVNIDKNKVHGRKNLHNISVVEFMLCTEGGWGTRQTQA